jgi:hypothetical protein
MSYADISTTGDVPCVFFRLRLEDKPFICPEKKYKGEYGRNETFD